MEYAGDKNIATCVRRCRDAEFFKDRLPPYSSQPREVCFRDSTLPISINITPRTTFLATCFQKASFKISSAGAMPRHLSSSRPDLSVFGCGTAEEIFLTWIGLRPEGHRLVDTIRLVHLRVNSGSLTDEINLCYLYFQNLRKLFTWRCEMTKIIDVPMEQCVALVVDPTNSRYFGETGEIRFHDFTESGTALVGFPSRAVDTFHDGMMEGNPRVPDILIFKREDPKLEKVRGQLLNIRYQLSELKHVTELDLPPGFRLVAKWWFWRLLTPPMPAPLPIPEGALWDDGHGKGLACLNVTEDGWRRFPDFICRKCESPAFSHPYSNRIWGCKKCGFTTGSVSAIASHFMPHPLNPAVKISQIYSL